MNPTTQLAKATPESLLARMGAPLSVDRYRWAAASATALTESEVFQLTYAAQVEWGTEGTFASLDITRDPLVKSFLRIWLEQEVVHADLLTRFLAESGVVVTPLHTLPCHRRGARRGRVLNRLARAAVGPDFFAVHMSWGAVNELTTLRFYQQIRARTKNELLREIMRDVIAQEALHYSFYRSMAVRYLTGNPRGQRVTRFALRRLWSPVGVGLRERVDVDRLMRELFADRSDVVRRIDTAINDIPGLADLDLIAHEMARTDAA